jgi:hypothetical protein
MVQRLKRIFEGPADGIENVVSKTTLCYAVMPTKLMLPIYASKLRSSN